MILRPAQKAILEYKKGYLAVNAVPGSGKTFTLSLLAAQLISEMNTEQDTQDSANNPQVLIVTYLNSSVETFKAPIMAKAFSKTIRKP